MVKERDELEIAYLASGCFWGPQYHLDKIQGVKETTVGYMGGTLENPSYPEVKSGTTGHVETVKVVFNRSETCYEEILRIYFETHDFTQVGGQGPDIGTQYRSVIFYSNEEQKRCAEKIIDELSKMGYKVATSLEPASTFWNGEEYHQDYYDKRGETPYCHIYKKIFNR